MAEVVKIDSEDDDTCGTRTGGTAMDGREVASGLDEEMPASLDEATTTTLLAAGGVLSVALWRTIDSVLEDEKIGVDEVVVTTGVVEVVAAIGVVEVVGSIELDATVLLPPPDEATELGPVGTSPARTHPVLAVRAAGHST